MPAKSEKQQKAAGIALSAKRNKKRVDSLKGPSKKMYQTMNQKQLKELAQSKSEKK